MTVAQDRVREVFFATLDLEPDAIPAYLREACGDDHALRAEVESLLGFHDDRPLVDPVAGVQPDEPGPAGDACRYQELEEIGVGGGGRVVRAWDEVLHRVVAFKQAPAGDAVRRAMLLQEARLLAWLDHPGAVPVYDACSDARSPSYAMRLLDGETLRERLDAEGPLSVAEATRILARVCETVANAHDKGLLHLDLKPANIMLLPYGQVCVLDWGIARFFDPSAYREWLSAFGVEGAEVGDSPAGRAGTASYVPVEQAAGEALTPATDIYACGTVLYEMLVGEVPFEVTNLRSAASIKSSQTARPLRAQRADVPGALESLCLRMIASDPADWPAGMGAVLAELDRLQHGGMTAAQRELDTGEVLLREGDAGDEAYQVLAGSLAIGFDGPDGFHEIARRGVGEMVGEMAVISRAVRTATVRAAEPSRVAVVTRSVIESALEESSPLVARMVRSLSARLREQTTRTAAETS